MNYIGRYKEIDNLDELREGLQLLQLRRDFYDNLSPASERPDFEREIAEIEKQLLFAPPAPEHPETVFQELDWDMQGFIADQQKSIDIFMRNAGTSIQQAITFSGREAVCAEAILSLFLPVTFYLPKPNEELKEWRVSVLQRLKTGLEGLYAIREQINEQEAPESQHGARYGNLVADDVYQALQNVKTGFLEEFIRKVEYKHDTLVSWLISQ